MASFNDQMSRTRQATDVDIEQAGTVARPNPSLIDALFEFLCVVETWANSVAIEDAAVQLVNGLDRLGRVLARLHWHPRACLYRVRCRDGM